MKIAMNTFSTNTTSTAGGVVLQTKTKKVLVVEQLNQIWSLPKGHLDAGETALEAAIREIKEETGVNKLTYIQELGEYERYKIAKDGEDDKSELKKITFFLFTTEQIKLQPEDLENPQAIWVDIHQVTSHLTHIKDKSFFNSVLPIIKNFMATSALDRE